MDIRTQIALELAKTYLSTEKYTFTDTWEALYWAVQDADVLMDVLKKEPGTVDAEKQSRIFSEAKELKSYDEDYKEQPLEEVIKDLEEETNKKKGWF